MMHLDNCRMLIASSDTPVSPDEQYKAFSATRNMEPEPRLFWLLVTELLNYGYLEFSNGIEMSLTESGRMRKAFAVLEA